MTTPPMKEISWLQEAKLRAKSKLEKFLTAAVPSWRCPPADKYRVHRDRTPAGPSEPIPWTPAYDMEVEIQPSRLDMSHGVRMTGMPVEAVPVGTQLRKVHIYSSMRGKPRDEMVPINPTGRAWIEGHPMSTGAFDRHWIGVEGDGTAHEYIQMAATGSKWRAMDGGVWSPSGELIRGFSCTAARRQLSSMLLTRDILDNPCVVGCVVPNYSTANGVGDAETDPNAPIACDDLLRLPNPPDPAVYPEGSDAWKVLMNLHTHGVRVYDRMGWGDGKMKIVTQAGEDWSGSNIGDIKLRSTDFERVPY